MNRRRFLIGAGVTTSVAVAGCLGDEDGPGSSGENGSPSDGDDSENGDDGAPDDEEASSSDGENESGDDSSTADGEDDGGGEEGDDDDGNGEDDDADNDNAEDDDAEDGGDGGGDESSDNEDDEDGDDEAGSGDDSNESGDGEADPETHTLEVEIGVEPGYNRPSAVTLEVGDERLETGEAVASFDLESGTHTLEVTAEGFETATRTVSLEEDTTVGIELQRQYEDIRIVDHDVSVVRRDDADDTVEATVVLENRSDFESTRIRVEASATDQDGDSFGYAESQARSVSPGERTDVQLNLLRSTTDTFEEGRSVGAYELAVTTAGTFRTLDTASG